MPPEYGHVHFPQGLADRCHFPWKAPVVEFRLMRIARGAARVLPSDRKCCPIHAAFPVPMLPLQPFIRLPTLEKCEHKNNFINILLYKSRFVVPFRRTCAAFLPAVFGTVGKGLERETLCPFPRLRRFGTHYRRCAQIRNLVF